jgi:hypothetical protein
MDIAKDLVRVGSMSEPESGPEAKFPAVWIPWIIDQNGTRQVMPEALIPKGKAWELWNKPEFEKQYPVFYKQAMAYKQRQFRWCEQRVTTADGWHAKRMVHEISDLDRKCGQFIGVNLNEHPWIEFTSFGKLIDCPFCGKGTSPLFPDCANCGKTINVALLKEVEAGVAAAAK